MHPKTYLEHFYDYEDELRNRAEKTGITITVSGPSSSGKTTICKELSDRFGLKYVSAGKIFREYAKERNMPIEKFSKVRDKIVDYEIDKQTLKEAMTGGCVMDGRLSGWVAGDWADIKIYVECNAVTRAKRYSKKMDIDFEDALRKIEKRDKHDNGKYLKLYGVDLFDKSIYDVIIVNESMSIREFKKVAIEKVKELLDE